MITSPPAPAVAYLRRSTDKQEQSLADQRAEIRRFAGHDIQATEWRAKVANESDVVAEDDQ